MKQTLRTHFHFRTKLILSGFLLFSLNASAQDAKYDSLQTSYINVSSASLTDPLYTILPDSISLGLVTSTEQFLAGRVPGLRVSDVNGAPGVGIGMLLRVGTSVLNKNSPVVVLDGVVLHDNMLPPYVTERQQEVFDHTYQSDLSFLNPDDIASARFVKDAALSAVYGADAINGVLFLESRKGLKDRKLQLNYAVTASLAELRKKNEKVLTATEFRDLINTRYPEQADLLGNENTDWQDVIYRNAVGFKHHLSANGTILKHTPYYVSFSHLDQDGIIKTSGYKRSSLMATVNPSFFKEHLSLQLTYRTVDQNKALIDRRALRAALEFDPTQPVYQKNNYGNYFTYLSHVPNPLSLLEQKHIVESDNFKLGQAHLKYNFHFFPALSLNARYAIFEQENDLSSLKDAKMALVSGSDTYPLHYREISYKWEQQEAYLNFNKGFAFLESSVSISSGAIRKRLESYSGIYENYNEGKEYTTSSRYFYSRSKHGTQNLYAQGVFNVKGRYTLNAALSKSSSPELLKDVSFLCSGLGISWDLASESFLSDFTPLSELKLFANYHGTDLLDSRSGAAAAREVTYEQKKKWNTGLAWSLLEGKISGTLNYFSTSTNDLLLIWPWYFGTGRYYKYLNYGTLKTHGLEASANYRVIFGNNVVWSLGANLSQQTNRVTFEDKKLNRLDFRGEQYLVALQDGEPLNSFYLYQQVYDENGLPKVEYVTNSNGFAERKIMHSVDPKFVWGVNSDLSYNRISAGLLISGAAGQYVYNFTDGFISKLLSVQSEYLINTSRTFIDNGYTYIPYGSDHYLEKASFARLENLHVSYDFGKIWKGRANISISAAVQNAFVLTKYSGQDPEVRYGIDNMHYPQPRTFSLSAKLSI